MANKYRKIDAKKLTELADQYCDECIDNTNDHATGSGKVVQVSSRHIPTIDYFLNIWIPLREKLDLIKRRTWYDWLRENSDKSRTIKNIEGEFVALGKDIVANEGKGIFYAKNKFGMHDRQQVETKNVEKFDFE